MTQTAAEQTRRPCEGVGSELPPVAKTAGEPRLFRLNCRGDHQFAILVPESRRTATHGLDIERKSLSDRSLFLQGNGVNTVGPSSASGPYAELAGTGRYPRGTHSQSFSCSIHRRRTGWAARLLRSRHAVRSSRWISGCRAAGVPQSQTICCPVMKLSTWTSSGYQ